MRHPPPPPLRPATTPLAAGAQRDRAQTVSRPWRNSTWREGQAGGCRPPGVWGANNVRIIAGRNRGRVLRAPEGTTTRPTAERVRQALFDMLWHAPWGGRTVVQDQLVLDAFAGTGALGLEALSRGADHVTFFEIDRAALSALRANIAACKEEPRSAVVAADATRPPRARVPCGLVFLDPPYGEGLVPKAVNRLDAAGWIAPGALLVAETALDEALDLPGFALVASRSHGAATLHVLRAPGVRAEDAP